MITKSEDWEVASLCFSIIVMLLIVWGITGNWLFILISTPLMVSYPWVLKEGWKRGE